MSPQPNETSCYTYRDYQAWPDDERWELIEGRAYAMTPAPGTAHQRTAVELTRQIANFLVNRPCELFTAPFDVRLLEGDETDEEIATVVQPDISFICNGSKIDEKGCRGAPEWIIEIVSPSTAATDHIHKLALYERHSVEEYWILHSTDRVVTLFRLTEDKTYGKPQYVEAKRQLPVRLFPELTIDWDLVFAKVTAGQS